jgi:hypothetical protein
MSADNRRHFRFCPEGLKAEIALIDLQTNKQVHLQGQVVDMSYSGIRIKLSSPMPANMPESQVKITVTMPKSGMTVNIKGSVRHMSQQAEYGVGYSHDHSEQEVDAFMFECIKTL